MRKRIPILLLFCLFLFTNGQAQVSKTINVTTPGTLSTLLTPNELSTVTDLTVTGSIDARDFKTMKYKMIVLDKIDISAVNINYYKGKGGPQEYFYTDTTSVTEYPANEIPTYAFYLFSWTSIGKESLISINLPNSITSIGENALRGCNGLVGNLIIPSKVTKIRNGAFQDCTGLTGSLIIPYSVKSIEDYAFFNCSGFNGALTLSESVESIGANAFQNCSHFTGPLIIPSGVSTINTNAFANCSSFNGSLTISNSVTTIGQGAFVGCSGFTGSLIIPPLVTTIQSDAFQACSGFNGNLTLSNSVTTIEDGAFEGCSGFTGSLTIPLSVTEIGLYAFMNCSGFNGSLSLPSSLELIRSNAFQSCSGFTGSLTIPSSVTMWDNAFYNCSGFNGTLTILSPNSIPDNAFYGCSGFTGSLNIPASTIGEYAFYNCKGFNGKLTLKSVMMDIGDYAFYGCSGFKGSLTIPDFGTANSGIGNYAFYGCSGLNGNLNLSSSITRIGDHAFYGCSGFTGSLNMPKNSNKYYDNVYGIYSIGAYAFAGCSGFNGILNLPDEKITQIGNYAFADCTGLVDYLTIPLGVTAIGDYTFSNCSGLNGSLTIPASVTSIGSGSFMNCIGLNGALAIPASITSIGSNAFTNCSNIKRINAYANNPSDISLGATVFSGISTTTCNLFVPVTKKQLYAIAAQWKDFINITEGVPVTLTTGGINSIYSTNPTGNGTITNIDLNDPTQYGVVWSTAPNPTIELSSKTIQGSATAIGPITYSISELTANTSYYVKTYATNSTGTSYGEQVTFTTPTPVISSPSISSLNGFKAVKGTASAVQTFTISGTGLVSNLVLTAPSGFEVQMSGASYFVPSVSLTPISGVVSEETIAVRIAASALSTGNISGDVVCSTAWINSQDVAVTGEITQLQLTISNPIVVINKMVDGNTSAVVTKTGTLQGVDDADANNVSVTATASYNNATVGTNKTIIVVYTLTGSSKDKYLAPANDTITNAKISDYVALIALEKPAPGCEGDNLDLSYVIKTGTPTQYKITFDDSAQNAGLKNIPYTNLPSNNISDILALPIPAKTEDGTFSGTLKMNNELNVESPDYPFTFTINVSSDYIRTKFNMLVMFDNSSNRFSGYQWYKNNIEVDGATKQFYVDPNGLTGSYSVKLTTTNGNTLYSCPIVLNRSSVKAQVTTFPNPVKENESFTVQLTGLTDDQLKVSKLSVYNIQGICVYETSVVMNLNQFNLSLSGAYIGHLTTTGIDYVFKIIVGK